MRKESLRTVALVDELRHRLPTMTLPEFLMLERSIPSLISTARQGGDRVQVKALEVLEEDVLRIREGFVARDLSRDLDDWFQMAARRTSGGE